MIRSALFCLAGIIFGAGIGFFVANNSTPVTAVASAPQPAGDAKNGAAPPLAPEQMTGEMPANHPPMDSGNNGTPDPSGGAATSPKIQAAMDEADRDPKNFDRQMAAAVAFYNNGAYAKAEVYLTRALEVKPNDTDALTGLANTKYDKGDYPAAQALYEKILAQKKDPDIQTDLGNTFFKRQDYGRAMAEYRKAIAINPQHEKAWQNLAAAALQKGDQATAREAVDKLAAINPQNQALTSFRQSLAQ